MHTIKSGRVIRRNNKTNKRIAPQRSSNRIRKCQETMATNYCRKSDPPITKTIKDSLKYVLNVINETNNVNNRRASDKYLDEPDEEEVSNDDNIVSYNQAVVSYQSAKPQNNNKLTRSTRNSSHPSLAFHLQVDPTDTFFSLMSATVKNFSKVDQHHVRNSVFNLINEIEGKNLKNLMTKSEENCKMCADETTTIQPNSGPPAGSKAALSGREHKSTTTINATIL
ncbi:uncharacterized protein [Rhodnius prolixus]|uniref:uncharacterized protein n=1 Tax=Rhodnius prolixus TaxID=13249 RepID=UPI003D18C5EE